MFRINIENHQNIDGELDIITQTANGNLYQKNDKIYIIYKTDETSNVIIADKTKVIHKTKGSVCLDMVFDKNNKTRTNYKINCGILNMDIKTEKIINNLTQNGGMLNIVYTILIQGQEIYNNMKITVNSLA